MKNKLLAGIFLFAVTCLFFYPIFMYQPQPFEIGRDITLASLLVIGILLLGLFFKKKHEENK